MRLGDLHTYTTEGIRQRILHRRGRLDAPDVDPKIDEMEPVALDAPELDPDRLGNLREELMAAIGEQSETAPAETES